MFQDFIVYDVGLQHTILHSIQALSGLEGFSRSVSILSWNFPFTDLELQDEVIRADCLARSSGMLITICSHLIKSNHIGTFKARNHQFSIGQKIGI
jgi:hypothetical protein